MQARIIGKLAVDMVPMIIDEADFLVGTTAALLEVVRDITDITGTMCFLVGMEQFALKVARHGHIASRVAKVVELQPLSLADVKATVSLKAQVAIDDDVLPVILEQSAGRMRLVLGAIANLEAWADANRWDRITLEHVARRALCTEFSGKSLGRRATVGGAAA